MLLIYAKDAISAAQIAQTAPVWHIWRWVSRPEHLAGCQDLNVVVAADVRSLPGHAAMVAELDARSCRIYTEFDLQQGRVR